MFFKRFRISRICQSMSPTTERAITTRWFMILRKRLSRASLDSTRARMPQEHIVSFIILPSCFSLSPTPRTFQDYRLRFQKFAIESSSRTPNNAQDSDSRSAEWLRFNRPFRRYLGKAAIQVKSGNGVGTGKRLCKIYRVCIFSEPP